jgi:Lrp/AsnC family leucine-responsive transcriptional regulator
MTEFFKLLDARGWKILSALQTNARLAYTDLAKEVALSVTATVDRVKRLEGAGIIRGYHADLAPETLGYPISALIGITVLQPQKGRFLELLEAIPEVVECFHVTGADSYIIRVCLPSIGGLEGFIARINHFGETRTSIILSTPIRRHLPLPGR